MTLLATATVTGNGATLRRTMVAGAGSAAEVADVHGQARTRRAVLTNEGSPRRRRSAPLGSGSGCLHNGEMAQNTPPTEPMNIANRVLRVDLNDPPRWKPLAEWLPDILTADRLQELRHELESHYAAADQTIPPGILVPHIYHSRYRKPPPDDHVYPPATPDPDVIQQTLLFAHGVEIVDPLLLATRYTVPLEPQPFIAALKFWRQFRPLIQSGVVRLTPDREGLAQQLPFLSMVDDNGFRHDLVRFLRSGGMDERVLDGWLRNGREHISDVDIGNDANRFESMLSAVIYGPISDVADDLTETLDVRQASEASIWFPSSRHVELLEIFLKRGMPDNLIGTPNGAVTRIAALDVPEVKRLRPSDLILIRQNSEVFEEWRAEVTAALAALDSLPAGISGGAHIVAIEEHMAGAALRLKQRIAAQRTTRLAGAFRTFGVGSFGAAVGASPAAVVGASGGVETLLVTSVVGGAAAAAARAIAETVLDITGQRKKSRALGAAFHHALLLSNREEGSI